MDDVTASWVAGLLEGEGSFSYYTYRNTQVNGDKVEYIYPQINLSMTDRDVVEALCERSGYGRTYGPYVNKKRPTHKPIWKWRIYKISEVKSFCERIKPYMYERRQSQIESMFAKMERRVVNDA